MSNNSQPEDNLDSELLMPPPSSKDPMERRFSRQLNITLSVDHWFVIDPVAMAEFIGEENFPKTLEQMIEEILEAECNYRMSRVWELLNRHRPLTEVDGEDLPEALLLQKRSRASGKIIHQLRVSGHSLRNYTAGSLPPT